MGRKTKGPSSSRSWDAVANWYIGWAGAEGSRHHRELAIPAAMRLLALRPGERLLDIGCGAGALAPSVLAAGARYSGIDNSPKLIAHGRRHHGSEVRLVVADATKLASGSAFRREEFDAVSFLLSLQDINPLEAALASARWALRRGGRLVILMTHPCFRIPRQSGWGWDEARGLRYRRIDRYLTPLDIPMQEYGRKGRRGRGTTRSYHRPLQSYVSALAAAGFVVDALNEIPAPALPEETRALRLSSEEFPLFLAVRAMKSC
ncbi:methyltransferase domain-containing protein [Parvibaculum sp.]|uniref:class I SAM-dependent methyltransferase n=2 Tax=Parvibaculum sp. TaxID=2024848 RepID=UPI001B250CDB|nr:methyltransferase domain-containing protein [Parvibaculum sp.]MBO6633585.1 class I SAM-dependent methyltransferase [Parvibaculum sp.]MBO6678884.1 class I SAM-dependent methyltransferase [Parvibaculum sp.]MBO6903392.1 class I SAM-dependent methyltransferase [Parvibaculum sp.]